MNFVHTSRDYPLQELSNLLPGLFYEVALARCKTLKQVWCFTRLLATLWESRSSPLLLGSSERKFGASFVIYAVNPPHQLVPMILQMFHVGINQAHLQKLGG